MILEAVFSALIVSVMIYFTARYVRNRRRDHSRVQSGLSRIERDRARALQGNYNCSSCPICLEDFKKPEDHTGTGSDQPPRYTRGSDNFPLQLLRCGHVFDKTCWSSFVSSGRGDPNKCPVCRADVRDFPDDELRSNSPADIRIDEDYDTDTNVLSSVNVGETANYQSLGRHRDSRHVPLDQDEHTYEEEMVFRLQRMSDRYPHFIRPNLVERWTDGSYSGSFVHDMNEHLHWMDGVFGSEMQSTSISSSGSSSVFDVSSDVDDELTEGIENGSYHGEEGSLISNDEISEDIDDEFGGDILTQNMELRGVY